MNLYVLFVALGLLAVLAWFVIGARRQANWRTPERQLERMVGPEAAARLIRFELERTPGLSRAAAARRAIERAEYDRGR